LDDQHTAGGILWAVAEVLDLPFLVLAATRWMRADAVEARRIDAELDAESASPPASALPAPSSPVRPDEHTALPAGTEAPAKPTHPDTPGMSRPWWLDDPELRDRYRN
jgi:putative copper resistance protein D